MFNLVRILLVIDRHLLLKVVNHQVRHVHSDRQTPPLAIASLAINMAMEIHDAELNVNKKINSDAPYVEIWM